MSCSTISEGGEVGGLDLVEALLGKRRAAVLHENDIQRLQCLGIRLLLGVQLALGLVALPHRPLQQLMKSLVV